MIIGKDFSTALSEELEAGDVSVKEIAALTGYSINSIYYYANGTRNPSWASAVKVLDALGFDVFIKRRSGRRPDKKYEGPVRVYNKKTGKWEETL